MGALNPARGRVRDLLRLSLVPGWGPRRIRSGLEDRGSVEALVAAAARGPGVRAAADEADRILDDCRRAGITATALDGEAYPLRLRHLPDPPPVVFHRGDVSVLAEPGIVIVGSRRATAYGRRVAGELAAQAARAGRVVISGLALGVDGAAHRGALEADGVTAGVLGSGVDRPSPRSHRPLLVDVLIRGAVLSEHPPGTPPRAHHFPRRNRLLAALADQVVVVEAAARSGALITARLALELGREVWAVPGSVFSPVSIGTHRLLEDGARPVTDLEAWSASLGARTGNGPAAPSAADSDGAELWALLADGPLGLEALQAASGLAASRVLSTLSRLELEGWVRRTSGPSFARRVA
ncbi:MAG TPA: DNA-processing protein DprA [Longimicrobiales bacterium]|nr:DNA-processing protein DprA [Longimicrobiales bacterium]